MSDKVTIRKLILRMQLWYVLLRKLYLEKRQLRTCGEDFLKGRTLIHKIRQDRRKLLSVLYLYCQQASLGNAVPK
jgi:hypothetical protein